MTPEQKFVIQKIDHAIKLFSVIYNVPLDRLRAHAWAESNYGEQGLNPHVVSFDKGHGIFQITEGFHRFAEDPAVNDVFLNTAYAAWFLCNLFRANHGDWKAASRAYNGAGPAAENYSAKIEAFVQTKPWQGLLDEANSVPSGGK